MTERALLIVLLSLPSVAHGQSAVLTDAGIVFGGSQAYVDDYYAVRWVDGPTRVHVHVPGPPMFPGGWGPAEWEGQQPIPLDVFGGLPFDYRVDFVTDGALTRWCEGSLPGGQERCYDVKEVPEPAAWQLALFVAVPIAYWLGRRYAPHALRARAATVYAKTIERRAMHPVGELTMQFVDGGDNIDLRDVDTVLGSKGAWLIAMERWLNTPTTATRSYASPAHS